MTWKMRPQEFANVAKLLPKARYEYFIKKVADHEELWGLWDEGWALLADEEEAELVPVWPHPDFAKAYANGEWQNFHPRLIELDDWLEEWIPEMLKDHRKVAVFPTADRLTTTAEPSRLRADLESELDKYA